MSGLFEASAINGMQMKNRFVRSATYEAMADPDGKAGDRIAAIMAQLAQGDVGLVISGHAYVTREGQAGPAQMGIYSDEMLDGLTQVVGAVHDNGSVTAAQLAHAGARAIGKGEFAPLAPSDVMDGDKRKATAMTLDDIDRTIRAFGDAAQRAAASGFDAVQVHSAHGYLLSQFLSPLYNKREDSYGGPLENRARFLIQVCREVRERVGDAYPVLVKINSEDFLEGGTEAEDVINVCKMLEDCGVDAIEMSGGTFDSGKFIPSRPGTAKSEDREVYYKRAAALYKKAVGIPLILVGGFLSLHIAEETVSSGLADYIALSRPLIREPHLVKRWAGGDRTKAACISCNKCFRTLFSSKGLYCAAEKKKK